MKARWIFAVCLVGSLAARAADADVIINVDENGLIATNVLNNGNVITSDVAIIADSPFGGTSQGPGWPANSNPVGIGWGATATGTQTQNLFLNTTRGDVVLLDPTTGNPTSDVLRFNGNGTLIFYSAPGGGSIADNFGLPGAFYSPTSANPGTGTPNAPGPPVFIIESAQGRATYTPTNATQAGFIPGQVTTYTFFSDGSATAVTVPEPSPLVLAGAAGVLGYAARSVRRRLVKRAA